jgi:primosomal protein N'
VDPPIARKRGRHRLQILLKAPKTGPLRAVVADAVRVHGTGRETITVDVDPLDMM